MRVAASIPSTRGAFVGTTTPIGGRLLRITDVETRLHVTAADGILLADLGLTGQSLQGGHCRMPTGGLAAAVRHMT